jgi:hypothetical protein
MVNEAATAWLKSLPQLADPNYDAQWESISALFNICKKAFNGKDDLALRLPGHSITLRARKREFC